MQSAHDPYDLVSYPSFCYPDTHPDRLAAMAILHGMQPAPVDRCRVLEIGCNEGANLIPMAYAIPGTEFVGFDLAPLPIGRGQDRIRALGLRNVRIFEGDLMDAGAELGAFDYIIAHGVYSWVPEPVRDKLLALCGELLAPNGVAFVSHEALPGAYLRKLTREMMMFGMGETADPAQQIANAHGLLELILGARPEGDVYGLIVKKQLESMAKRGPQVVYHDELAPDYHPVSIMEFAQHAGRHGLQYLSESVLPPPKDPGSTSEFKKAIEGLADGDVLREEQLKDFARMRVFRETLLCRAEQTLRRGFRGEDLRRLLVASEAASGLSATHGAKVFTRQGGLKLETDHAGAIALIERLEAAWPHALALSDLEPELAEAGLTLDSEGAAMLMQLAEARFITFHAWKAPLASEISARPRASAASRQEGAMRTYTTTLRHRRFLLNDPGMRRLLLLLDGTRDRVAIREAMMPAMPEVPVEELEKGIERNLGVIYRSALLEA